MNAAILTMNELIVCGLILDGENENEVVHICSLVVVIVVLSFTGLL